MASNEHCDRTLNATPLEENRLFRKLVSDTYNVMTGWFWFQNDKKDRIAFRLFRLAVYDQEEVIRASAIKMLSLGGIQLKAAWITKLGLLERILADDAASVRKNALTYVGIVGTLEDLELVDKALSDTVPSIRLAALEAKASIIGRSDPNEAFSLSLSPLIAPLKRIPEDVGTRATELWQDLLFKALHQNDDTLRTFAVKELSRRGELGSDVIERMLTDSAQEVKLIYLREALERGIDVDLEATLKTLSFTNSDHFRYLLIRA